MRRLVPPQCTCCKQSNATYESTLFPSVQICHPCHANFSEWLTLHSEKQWNPILEEFGHWAAPAFKMYDGTPIRMIWIKSSLGRHAWTQVSVTLPYDLAQLESENKFENPLDILDGL